MARHRSTDDQWELIAGIFSPPAHTGRPRVDRRMVVDGILWIMRTGAFWRDLPEELGKWGTVDDLFTTWNQEGTLDEILDLLRSAHVDGERSTTSCGASMARPFGSPGVLMEP